MDPTTIFPTVRKLRSPSEGGADGYSKLPGWQDKRATYLSSKKLEVAKWLSWASMQKEKIDFGVGGGKILAEFPEARYFDRQIYDALR